VRNASKLTDAAAEKDTGGRGGHGGPWGSPGAVGVRIKCGRLPDAGPSFRRSAVRSPALLAHVDVSLSKTLNPHGSVAVLRRVNVCQRQTGCLAGHVKFQTL